MARPLYALRVPTAGVLLAATVTCLASVTGPASAATTVCAATNARTDVTTTSLGPALAAAKAGDTVNVRGTCTGNFTVTVPLTLVGAGPLVTLSAGGHGTVLTLDVPKGTVTIRTLKITDGSASDGGGVAADVGATDPLTLDLVDDRITGDTAASDGAGLDTGRITALNITSSAFTDDTLTGTSTSKGAAIATSATADIYDSNIIGNAVSASSATKVLGGALYLSGPTTLNVDYVNQTAVTGGQVLGGGIDSTAPLSIIDSQVAGNTVVARSGPITGGGIYAGGSTLTIDTTNVSDNAAKTTAGDIRGAGIDLGTTTRLGLAHSSVSTNSATSTSGPITGVGIAGGAANTLTNSSVSHNVGRSTTGSVRGGGIAGGGSLAISSGPVTANSVSSTRGQTRGGAVFSEGRTSMTSVTLTGNTASTAGGGVFLLSAPLTITSSDLVGNTAPSGDAIDNSGGTVTTSHSLILGTCVDCG